MRGIMPPKPSVSRRWRATWALAFPCARFGLTILQGCSDAALRRQDSEFEIFARIGYNRDQWTVRNLPGRPGIGVTAPEIEVLFASVGLERAPQPRLAPVIFSADFQLVRWRLLLSLIHISEPTRPY